jgi:hypothetical protein
MRGAVNEMSLGYRVDKVPTWISWLCERVKRPQWIFVLGLVTVEANCSQQSAIRLHRGMNAASALISHGGGAMEPDSNRPCSGSDNPQDLERDYKRLNQKGVPQFKVL